MASSLRLLVAAAAAVGASHAGVFPRNDYPAQPPCTYPYTPFVYAGCYADPSQPRSLNYDPGLDSSNMTVQLCTASCKANGFRYAGLEYYGQCFCGTSVTGPGAIDPSQCNDPCTGDQTQTCGGFDAMSIYMDPTFPISNPATIDDYVSQGCYTEESGGRAVAFRQDQLNSSSLTTESCLQACKSNNYPLAATEFSGECYCGVVLGNGSVPAPASDCNMPCSGDSTETCGGASRLNLYMANDLAEALPCAPPSTSSTTTSSGSAPTTSTVPTTSAPGTTTTSTTSSAKPSTTTSSCKSSTTTTTTSSAPATKTTSPSRPSCTPTPPCEWSCGKWCSKPLPPFGSSSCDQAVASCLVQTADCFNHAGWPAALKCLDFNKWCSNVKQYCNSPSCKGPGRGGICSKSDCVKKNPPQGPPPTPGCP